MQLDIGALKFLHSVALADSSTNNTVRIQRANELEAVFSDGCKMITQSTDETLKTLRQTDKSTFEGNESARLLALNEARNLVARLQKPHELVETLIWTYPMTLMCIKIADDAGWLRQLTDRPKTVLQLAAETGTDAALIRRVLRMLACTHVVSETDLDTYADGEPSAGLKERTGPLSGIDYFWDQGIDRLWKLPEFLRETGYKNPDDADKTPCKYITGYPSFWEWLRQTPEAQSHFNSLMSSMRSGQAPWVVHYPVQHVLEGYDGSSVLCVDVGGGKGRDMAHLSEALPRGYESLRIVVQDVASVVEEAKKEDLPANIELAEHDFFTAQPVEGAKAYFLHSICHDWPDRESARILSRLKVAMTPGYSKLLLLETVMPDRAKDMTPRMAAMDLNMMSHFSALERTEGQWTALLKGAGFKWNGFFARPGAHQGIIEAELA